MNDFYIANWPAAVEAKISGEALPSIETQTEPESL